MAPVVAQLIERCEARAAEKPAEQGSVLVQRFRQRRRFAPVD